MSKLKDCKLTFRHCNHNAHESFKFRLGSYSLGVVVHRRNVTIVFYCVKACLFQVNDVPLQ